MVGRGGARLTTGSAQLRINADVPTKNLAEPRIDTDALLKNSAESRTDTDALLKNSAESRTDTDALLKNSAESRTDTDALMKNGAESGLKRLSASRHRRRSRENRDLSRRGSREESRDVRGLRRFFSSYSGCFLY